MSDNAQLINQDSGDYEYYTPIEIVEAAREVMGGITLDPASSIIANERIKAKWFYSAVIRVADVLEWQDLPALVKIEGGLDFEWYANVWMNHPFARPESPCKLNCIKKICRKRGYHTKITLPGNKDWINHLMVEHFKGNIIQSCNITYAATSETWFRPLLGYIQCFLSPRTNYYLPGGAKKKGVTKGSVVTYMGPNILRFRQVFSELGAVK